LQELARRVTASGVYESAGRRRRGEKKAKEVTNLLLSRSADTCQRIAEGAFS